MTLYIVTSFRPVRRHLKHELLALKTKEWTASELTKIVCTQGPGAHFCA